MGETFVGMLDMRGRVQIPKSIEKVEGLTRGEYVRITIEKIEKKD